jgi:DNA-binding PadR family transcriptional regulator
MPSDDVLLAAIARAELHQGPDTPGVRLATVKQHLQLDPAGWTTTRLQPKLEALQSAGLIEQSRRNSKIVWRLTATGHRRLKAVGDKLTLPEAPQHRRWREAREAASQQIASIREEVRAALLEASTLIQADPYGYSEAWFDLSEQLRDGCWRLASATYCLSEWTEPDDASVDVDNATTTRRGRRELLRWTRR